MEGNGKVREMKKERKGAPCAQRRPGPVWIWLSSCKRTQARLCVCVCVWASVCMRRRAWQHQQPLKAPSRTLPQACRAQCWPRTEQLSSRGLSGLRS